jgi:hypothetical protein
MSSKCARWSPISMGIATSVSVRDQGAVGRRLGVLMTHHRRPDRDSGSSRFWAEWSTAVDPKRAFLAASRMSGSGREQPISCWTPKPSKQTFTIADLGESSKQPNGSFES